MAHLIRGVLLSVALTGFCESKGGGNSHPLWGRPSLM